MINKFGFLWITIIAICLSVELLGSEEKPIALIGNTYSNKAILNEIAKVEGVVCKEFSTEKILPLASDYSKYSMVIFSEGAGKLYGKKGIWSPDDLQVVRAYLHSGGWLMISGSEAVALSGHTKFTGIEDIMGFTGLFRTSAKGEKISEIRWEKRFKKELDLPDLDYQKIHRFGVLATGVHSNVRVLANAITSKGNQGAYILVNPVGSGGVVYIGDTFFRSSAIIPKDRGAADAQGIFILNENGQLKAALNRIHTSLILLSNPQRGKVAKEVWNSKPLGKAGKLQYPSKTMDYMPDKKRNFSSNSAPLPVLKNGEAKAIIVCSHENRKEANNFRNIFAKLTRIELPVEIYSPQRINISKTGLRRSSSDDTVILFATPELLKKAEIELGHDEIVVKSLPGGVVIGGVDFNAALNFTLERLGFRFLWPGRLGTVIPKLTNLTFPGTNCIAPVPVGARNIRPLSNNRGVIAATNSALSKLGITQNDYPKYYTARNEELKYVNWYRALGMGNQTKPIATISFDKYYAKYGKDHQDWFALQFDGLRTQELSPHRARLCKSNLGLQRQVVADALGKLKSNPDVQGIRISFNDGGYTSFCLCEKCRLWDPVNSPKIDFSIITSTTRFKVPYVSITDRMLRFANVIAKEVERKYQNQYHVDFLAYSIYEYPPQAIRPHRNMTINYVGGHYWSESYRQKHLKNFRAWSTFGNPICWRPNALGYGKNGAGLLQNYGRKLFYDTLFFRQNGVWKFDHDCNNNAWALNGWINYVAAKAMLNLEGLTYNELMDDYCQKGFGAAANEIKTYLNEVEKVSEAYANRGELKRPLVTFYTPEIIEKLSSLLKRARVKVNGIEAQRVEFMQCGLRSTAMLTAIASAKDNLEKRKKLVKSFKEMVRIESLKHPMALFGPNVIFAIQKN